MKPSSSKSLVKCEKAGRHMVGAKAATGQFRYGKSGTLLGEDTYPGNPEHATSGWVAKPPLTVPITKRQFVAVSVAVTSVA